MTTPEPAGQGIGRLLAHGVLDAELAALVWLTVEAGIPLVVAGGPPGCRAAVREAVLDFVPHDARRVVLAGDREDFGWLPEATGLGWRPEDPAPVTNRPAAPGTGRVVMVADLVPGSAEGTWGSRARLAIRALSVGASMAATTEGDRLEDVLGRLAAWPVAAIDDELTRLGIVLIVSSEAAATGDAEAADGAAAASPPAATAATAGPQGCRVVAAHYLRPVQRDVHGHVQRLAPAVLATWAGREGRFEHFAWGVVDELAGRTGRRPLEFEQEQARRSGYLAHLATRAAG